MPHGQNTVHVTYRLLDGTPGTVRLRRCGRRSSSAATTRRSTTSLAESYTLTVCDGRYEVQRGRRSCPPLRLLVHGDRAALTLDEKGAGGVPYEMERSRGYESVGSLWSPGYFRADLRPEREVTLVASTEPWETDSWRCRPQDAAQRRSASAAAGCVAIAGDRRRGSARRRAGARRRSVHHHAGRPRRGSGARARRRRRSAHGHRRLSLVHRLGPRHDDQPRGADADDGPVPRGGLHPAHVRALRPRRPHPEHVPRRRARRALSHRRRDAVVLPRGRALRRSRPATPTRCASCCRCSLDIVAAPSAGHAFGIGVDPADGLLRAGRRGLPAHLDGRQGRRLGRDAAARQGGRDQRALVQRAAPAATAGREQFGGGDGDLRPGGSRRAARASRSTGASGTTRAATCTTSSTAKRATTRRAGRIRCSRSRSTIRCSIASAGSRCWRSCASGC